MFTLTKRVVLYATNGALSQRQPQGMRRCAGQVAAASEVFFYAGLRCLPG